MKKYPVTTRHLASHTAGIRHYQGMEFMSNIEYNAVQPAIDIFKDSELKFQPGTEYSYSSYGWNLISAAMEGASGIEFREWMKTNVFDPLSMQNTIPESIHTQPDEMVSFYMHNDKGENIPSYIVNNSCKWAGGGFISTAYDLVSFSSGIQNNSLFTESTKDKYWSPSILTDGTNTNYGLGWSSNIDDKGRQWVGHSGGSAGGTSMYLLYPEEKLTVITLVNLGRARMNGLAAKIAALILNDH